jgi:hypothetical protein
MISGVVYSEYAPYCSKWGWCVWTSLYGDQGEKPQSRHFRVLLLNGASCNACVTKRSITIIYVCMAALC